MTKRTTGEGPNPSGLCMCGCGGATPIARSSDVRYGYVAGTPMRYMNGHGNRGVGPEYLVDPDTECWVWQRYIGECGYGISSTCGRPRLAHRLYWERAHGTVPKGLELDHLCRNRACVNPDHMEPVSHTENMRRGSSTKLTIDQVDEIRARTRTEGIPRTLLASAYGVTPENIGRIVLGKSWRSDG